MKEFLQAEIAKLEGELAAAKAKLEAFCTEIPAELHDLPHSVWEKIKAFFA